MASLSCTVPTPLASFRSLLGGCLSGAPEPRFPGRPRHWQREQRGNDGAKIHCPVGTVRWERYRQGPPTSSVRFRPTEGDDGAGGRAKLKVVHGTGQELLLAC